MSNEAVSKRAEAVRAVISKMTEDQVWDSLQARDIDPLIIDHVTTCLESQMSAGEIAKSLGLIGGRNSKQWKKIQAYFRQGFRADAEAYLYQQTHEFYKVIAKAKEVLEDAFENGTPQVIPGGKHGPTEVIQVKGATKELGSFIKNYSDAISMPVKLWKDYGAIGERKDVGTGGVTINVMNHIPMPTIAEIKKHKDEIEAKAKAIETTGRELEKS